MCPVTIDDSAVVTSREIPRRARRKIMNRRPAGFKRIRHLLHTLDRNVALLKDVKPSTTTRWQIVRIANGVAKLHAHARTVRQLTSRRRLESHGIDPRRLSRLGRGIAAAIKSISQAAQFILESK